MKAGYRVALMLGLVTLGATSLEAAEIDTPPTADEGVRVVNNYIQTVRVYAEDAKGRLHHLGRVEKGELQEFDIPEMVSSGEFRIKVFPGQNALEAFGVKSNPLNFERDSRVTFWIQPDLESSVVELARG